MRMLDTKCPVLKTGLRGRLIKRSSQHRADRLGWSFVHCKIAPHCHEANSDNQIGRKLESVGPTRENQLFGLLTFNAAAFPRK